MKRFLLVTILFLSGIFFLAGCGQDPAYFGGSGEGTGQYLKNAAGKDAEIRADISEIRSSLLAYAQVNGNFPPGLQSLLPQYLEEIPVSPITNEPYEYRGDLLGGDYELKYEFSDGKVYTANKNTTDLQWKDDFDKPDLD